MQEADMYTLGDCKEMKYYETNQGQMELLKYLLYSVRLQGKEISWQSSFNKNFEQPLGRLELGDSWALPT